MTKRGNCYKIDTTINFKGNDGKEIRSRSDFQRVDGRCESIRTAEDSSSPSRRENRVKNAK